MKNLITILLIFILSCCVGCSSKSNDEIISSTNIKDHQIAIAQNYNLEEIKYSQKYYDWKNPTTGGAIHINENDEIELYQSFTWFEPKEKGYFEKISVSNPNFHLKINGVGFGNSPSVLLTSEYNIKESVSFKKIINELSKSNYIIYYIK